MIALALTVLLTVTGAVTVFLAGALSLTAPFIKLGGRGRPEVKGKGKVKAEAEGKGKVKAEEEVKGKAVATGKTGTAAGLGTLAKGCLVATLLAALGFKGHVVLFVPADPHREQAPPPYWLINIYLHVIFLFTFRGRQAAGWTLFTNAHPTTCPERFVMSTCFRVCF